MTEEDAFVLFTRRMVAFQLSREPSLEAVMRTVAGRCSLEVRHLAAHRMERAVAEGAEALDRLWSLSKGQFFTPAEQRPAATRMWIAALRDTTVPSEPWGEPTIIHADDVRKGGPSPT